MAVCEIDMQGRIVKGIFKDWKIKESSLSAERVVFEGPKNLSNIVVKRDVENWDDEENVLNVVADAFVADLDKCAKRMERIPSFKTYFKKYLAGRNTGDNTQKQREEQAKEDQIDVVYTWRELNVKPLIEDLSIEALEGMKKILPDKMNDVLYASYENSDAQNIDAELHAELMVNLFNEYVERDIDKEIETKTLDFAKQ